MTSSSPAPTPTSFPVVIIGGGLSGLSTAANLTAHNIRFLLLEATSHLGGRVHSIPSPALDLGATWFHGTRGNAAYALAVSSGLIPCPPSSHNDEYDDQEEDVGVLVCSAPGRLVSRGVARPLSPHVALPVARAFARDLSALATVHPRPAPHVSVRDFIRARLGWHHMPPLERAVVRARERLQCTLDGCDDSPQQVSAARYADYRTLPGGNQPAPQGGMATVVAALSARLAGGEVRLGKEVTRVDWHGDAQIAVSTRDGAVVNACCVVWTPGVNVTKAAVRDGVFQPPLPAEKMAALAGRGMGAVEKVFAVLGRPLDGVEANYAMPVYWAEEEGEGERRRWQESVYALTYDEGKLAVSLWLHGAAGREFCGLGEDVAREEMRMLLTMVYGQEVAVERVILSNWGGNPFTRGSYSFPAVGCEEGAIERLASPVPSEDNPRLCFAGEATHDRFYSTMHGAIETGEREAERIAAFLKLRDRLEGTQG